MNSKETSTSKVLLASRETTSHFLGRKKWRQFTAYSDYDSTVLASAFRPDPQKPTVSCIL